MDSVSSKKFYFDNEYLVWTNLIVYNSEHPDCGIPLIKAGN